MKNIIVNEKVISITGSGDDDKEYWYTKVSKNLTVIYFIHWCIIGFIDSIFGYLMEIIFPYYVLL